MTLPARSRLTSNVIVWPSIELEARPVRAYEPELIVDSAGKVGPRIAFVEVREGPSAFDLVGVRELPDEFYLRELRDVDADDDLALVQFAYTWGPLLLRRRRLEDLSLTPAGWDGYQGAFRELWPFADLPAINPPPREPRVYEMTLEEYRAALRDVQNVCNCWLALAGAISVDQVGSLSLSLPMASLPPGCDAQLVQAWERRLERPPALDDLWSAVEIALALLLRPFHPVLFRRTREVTLASGARFELPSAALSPVDLDQAIALQLFGHITEGAQYKRCQKPECNRLFVRQRGAAKDAQQWTTGVSYCERRHATSEASREYRRRLKTVKDLHALGLSVRAIAERMGKSPATISRWLQRADGEE